MVGFMGLQARKLTHGKHVSFVLSPERLQYINCYTDFSQQQFFVVWNLNDLDVWKLQNRAVVRKSTDSDAKMEF